MNQLYDRYTPDDFKVWQALFERQQFLLPGKASQVYLQSVQTVGFKATEIPRFDEVNEILRKRTGFSLYAVPGIVPDMEFFELLMQRKFPATTWLRKPHQLDYIEEPDMFHDVFGHVPLLAVPAFADFLEGLATIAHPHAHNPLIVELVARLYWFTVEFGLLQEEEGLRIYGAGILSSVGETAFCLGPVPQRIPFDVQRIMATAFHKDRFQDKYYVINDFEQLFGSLPEIDRVINAVVQVRQEALQPKPAGLGVEAAASLALNQAVLQLA
jgi:phenylalanine-4-hydroxylase